MTSHDSDSSPEERSEAPDTPDEGGAMTYEEFIATHRAMTYDEFIAKHLTFPYSNPVRTQR